MAQYQHIHEYYDIDEILASAEMVPGITKHMACDLGWMDEQNLDESDLPADTRVEMPFWLACQLAHRNAIDLDLPRMMQPKYIEMLKAEPECIDLQNKSPFFYEFGMMYADLIDDKAIAFMLCFVMDRRYKEIVKRTVNRKQSESQEFVQRLCNMERILHESKAAGLLQYAKFANRSAIQLTIAPVLASLQSFSHLQRQSSAMSASAAAAAAARRNGAAGAQQQQQTGITATQQQQQRANQQNGRLPNTLPSTSAGGASSDPTQAPHAASSSVGARPSSTLATLNLLNASNLPLPSHGRKRFGMAATQQREQLTQAQNAQRAYDPTNPNNQQQQQATQAAAARKRRNATQNQ